MNSLVISGETQGDSPDLAQRADQEAPRVVWSDSTSETTLTYFENEMLEISFVHGTRFKLSSATEVTRTALAHTGSTIRYLLIDVSGLDDVDMCLSTYFDEVSEGIPVSLLGSGPADQVLARFFMRKIDPLHRCSYAETRADALEFLQKHA